MPTRDQRMLVMTPLAPSEKSKSLGSGGSMVARLKLKGIDGRAPPGVKHEALAPFYTLKLRESPKAAQATKPAGKPSRWPS